jgi:amino acid adenylation domain-containing protein
MNNVKRQQDKISINQKREFLEMLLRQKIGMSSNMQIVSSSQQAMWFLYKMMPNSSAYNLKHAVRIKSSINASLLKKAMEVIVQRHPILRTTYSDFKGKMIKTVQKTNPPSCFYFEEKDATSFKKEELEKYFTEKCEEPFDLERGPIIKGFLIRVSSTYSIFLLSVHHIASDFVTLEIIQKELGEVYTCIKNGKGIKLAVPALKYTDFAKQEARFLSSNNIKTLREYWINILSGDLPVLNLPIDKPQPKIVNQKGKLVRFNINKDLTSKVQQLAATCHTTPYRLFMAAYYLLLHRYTGQSDIIVGSPVSLRERTNFQDTVGYFVNMLPFRLNLNNNPSFTELLSRVHNIILEGLKNAKYPFSRTVAELQPDRDLNRSPIFQTSFTMLKSNDESLAGRARFYLGGSDARLKFGELEIESLEFTDCASQYALSLFMEEVNGEYYSWFLYQTDLFYNSTIEQMAGHFTNILSEVTENPDKGIEQYTVISLEERNRVLNVWNSSDVVYPKNFCIHELIEKRALEDPEAVAVSFGDSILSYRELDQKSNQLGWFLRRHGVTPGMMVPICLEPSIDMIVCIIGILKSGGAYVPLNPDYPRDRISTILEEIQPIVIISESKIVDRIPTHFAKILLVDQKWDMVSVEETKALDCLTKPEDTAYIIYTSGSTGKPKGVMVSHYNVIRLFKATENWYQFGKEDAWTLFHSFAFDFSVWEIFGALIYGGRLVVVPYFITRSPDDFYKLLNKEKVTVLNQTPSAFRQMIRVDQKLHETYKLSLRYIIFGGEALELKTLEPWLERHGDRMPQLINMYGITETTVHVTYRPITLEDVKKGSGSVIGVPIPDLQVYILDENKNIVPNGCCGEIYVGGAGVTKGYFKRDDLTKQVFQEDSISQINGKRVYRSGDLARYLHNGDIEYLGRIDHQVKIRGFRIELGDIEAKILAFPGVCEVIVIVREDIADDKRLTAYIVMMENAFLDIGKLRTFLKERIPEYMVPAAFVKVFSIPMTSNGKVDRKLLPAPIALKRNDGVEFIELQTELEKAIANIWKEVLDIGYVGLENNFFDLGGNSMLIVEAHSRIQSEIFQGIEIIDLFRFTTIKSLTDFIKTKRNSNAKNDRVEDRARFRKNARLKRNNAEKNEKAAKLEGECS